MLTLEEDGKLVGRPMSCLARPDENHIYFISRLDAKVGEIGGSAPVNLGFSDPHKNTYLSLAGTARTSQDREKLRELWSPHIEAWLPQGPDGDDVVLITVEPEDAKLWDSTSSALVYAAKVLKANITQTPPDGGKVEEVHMGGASGGGEGSQAPTSGDFRAYDVALSDTAGIGASSAGGPAS
jgi:general stress protein 26